VPGSATNRKPRWGIPSSAKSLTLSILFQKVISLQKFFAMTFERTYEIQNNQLIITLPNSFRNKKRVRVIVEDVDQNHSDKMNLLKKASTDPMFLADINEVSDDFENSDNESL
jgi:hypothetical protein